MKLGRMLGGSWIARRSTTLLAFTAVGGGLMVLAHICLARVMDQSDYGTMNYAIGLVEFIMSFALCGLPTVLIREVASARAAGKARNVIGGIRFVRGAVLFASLAVAGGAGIFLLFWANRDMPLDRLGLLATMLYVVVLAQLDSEQALLNGLRAPIAAAWPNQLLRPLVIMAGAGLIYGTQAGGSNEGLLAIAAGTLVALAATTVLARSRLRSQTAAAGGLPIPLEASQRWAWIRSGAVMTGGNIARNLQHRASFIILGFYVAPAEIALFAVALQFARLIQLALASITNVASPVMAEAIRMGDHAALRQAYSHSLRWLALVATGAGLVIALGGHLLLGLYGESYIAAYDIVLVVVGARLVAALTGPTAAIMMMGHDEGRLLQILWIGGICSVTASFVMIPAFGAIGAAWALLTGVLVSNTLMLAFLRRKYGLSLIDALLGRHDTPA